jgi:hypothetical protein
MINYVFTIIKTPTRQQDNNKKDTNLQVKRWQHI